MSKHGTLGKQHKIGAHDLRFAANIVRSHVTGSRPAQAALTVEAHRKSLFKLIKRLELAATYEEQNDE